MDMIKFLNKRKKENRQSLIIDNFNVDALKEQLAQKRNSISSETTHSNESPSEIIPTPQNYTSTTLNDKYVDKYIDNYIDKHNDNYIDKHNGKHNDISSLTSHEPTQDIIKRDINQDIKYVNRNFKINEKEKETEILKENTSISRPPKMDRFEKPIMSGVPESDYYNSTVNSYDSLPQPTKKQNEHTCNLCHNQNNIKDNFMILTCGHIFHIRCLVDSHYTDANRYGVIDEDYLNSRICSVCSKHMEMEDILYIHNKFYKNTKEYINKQDDIIEQLDKQMTKLKEELRVCYEYKQKLEHQREKSRQITVTINTMM